MLPEILKYFSKYIETELGIVYAEHNYFQLQNRLEEIAKILGTGGLEELYQKAKGFLVIECDPLCAIFFLW